MGNLSQVPSNQQMVASTHQVLAFMRGLSGLQSRTPARWSQCHLALQGRVLGTVPAVGMVGGMYIPRTGDGRGDSDARVPLEGQLAVMSS